MFWPSQSVWWHYWIDCFVMSNIYDSLTKVFIPYNIWCVDGAGELTSVLEFREFIFRQIYTTALKDPWKPTYLTSQQHADETVTTDLHRQASKADLASESLTLSRHPSVRQRRSLRLSDSSGHHSPIRTKAHGRVGHQGWIDQQSTIVARHPSIWRDQGIDRELSI